MNDSAEQLWIEIAIPNVDTDKARRKLRARRRWSLYRDGKSTGHKTRGGLGEVGRLIARERRRRK